MTLFSRFRSVPLNHFLVSGAVWLVLLCAGRGLWHAGCYTVGRVRQVLQLIAWAESLTDGDRANLPPFFGRHAKRTGPLEKWIRKHLPRRPREEAESAAEAFRTAAGLLRSGGLTGERDTFAELTWRLETAVDYESWHPFLMELSARIGEELGGTGAAPEELADLLTRVAETIEPQTAEAAAGKEGNDHGETNGETRRPETEENGGEESGKGESEGETESESRAEKNGERGNEEGAGGRGGCPGGACRYGWRYYGF